MGDEYDDYKPMTRAVRVTSLSMEQAIKATVASMSEKFRQILGSDPIIEVNSYKTGCFILSTFGAGVYKNVAQFSVVQLPGCCGVVVFFHASVAEDFRQKGLGSLLLEVREEAAIKAGFTIALATILKSNTTERSLLDKSGWETNAGADFKNVRTKNEVVMLTKRLYRS
jgi:GNAT superfamily N-acetyltransferase